MDFPTPILETTLSERLRRLRGQAPRRRPSVRALAAFAAHTDCRLAALGFAAGVNFDHLLTHTRFDPRAGQSPFAFARGNRFEETLRRDDYAGYRRLLEAEGGAAIPPARVVNLRDRRPMDDRAASGRAMLDQVVRRDPGRPDLIDGLVLTTPILGMDAHFEADALATCLGDAARVVEAKSFPRVDDRCDPDKLAAAADQAAFYIELVRRQVDRLGGDPERLVSEEAVFVTPRNVGLTPILSRLNVGPRVCRSRRLLAALPTLDDVIGDVPTDASFGPIADATQPEERRIDLLGDLADWVGTAYKPACLAGCGNALFCRARAFAAGNPCVVGSAAVRLLPGISSLRRAAELSRGVPAAGGEGPAAGLLADAGRVLDRLSARPPAAEGRCA